MCLACCPTVFCTIGTVEEYIDRFSIALSLELPSQLELAGHKGRPGCMVEVAGGGRHLKKFG